MRTRRWLVSVSLGLHLVVVLALFVAGSWRLEQLMSAGYGPGEAKFLARRLDVDLHEATDLLRHGCPSDLAVAILR